MRQRASLMVIMCSFGLFFSVIASACGGGTSSTAPTLTPTPSHLLNQNVINVDMAESPYQFKPKILQLKRGINYTLIFKGSTEFHTYTVVDLDLNVNVPSNETVTVQFTPIISGSFELVCVPHEHDGMVGTVNVND